MALNIKYKDKKEVLMEGHNAFSILNDYGLSSLYAVLKDGKISWWKEADKLCFQQQSQIDGDQKSVYGKSVWLKSPNLKQSIINGLMELFHMTGASMDSLYTCQMNWNLVTEGDVVSASAGVTLKDIVDKVPISSPIPGYTTISADYSNDLAGTCSVSSSVGLSQSTITQGSVMTTYGLENLIPILVKLNVPWKYKPVATEVYFGNGVEMTCTGPLPHLAYNSLSELKTAQGMILTALNTYLSNIGSNTSFSLEEDKVHQLEVIKAISVKAPKAKKTLPESTTPLNLKEAMTPFDSKLLGTLAEATELYQPVTSTSAGSKYVVVALSDDLKVAIRHKAGKLSVRYEGNLSKYGSTLKLAGVTVGDGYASIHLHTDSSMLRDKSLASLIYGLGVPFTKVADFKVMFSNGIVGV